MAAQDMNAQSDLLLSSSSWMRKISSENMAVCISWESKQIEISILKTLMLWEMVNISKGFMEWTITNH